MKKDSFDVTFLDVVLATESSVCGSYRSGVGTHPMFSVTPYAMDSSTLSYSPLYSVEVRQ